jgi:transposase
VPYVTLMREEAPQREYSLRAVCNALRWIGRTGAPWRMLPHDFPPGPAVSQQTPRWLKAGVFEAVVEDVRVVLRVAPGREGQPSAAIFESRTLHSRPESGHRAGYDGAKRKRGSKGHMAVDPWGQLLALRVRAANEQDRAQGRELAAQVQERTGEAVEIAFVDQAYTGAQPAPEAAAHGIQLEVIKLPAAKQGFVLLPRRWVVERSFAGAARFRRRVRDYERLPETVAGLHFLAFAILMLNRFVTLMVQSA